MIKNPSSTSSLQPETPQDVFGQKHLPALDGLRFVAVLMVIFDHGGLHHLGGDGVTYFFVLSGFLFSWLLSRQWEKKQSISYRRFYFRRTFRIVPACYCCLLFTILAKNALGFPVDYAHAFSAFTYTANYYNAIFDHPATGFSFFWSLSVEEQFYLVWPVVFAFFMHRGRKSLIRFLYCTIFVVCSWRSWLAINHLASHAWLYNAFDTRIDSIAIGCLLGMLIQENWFQAVVQKMTRYFWMPFVSISLLVAAHSLPEQFHYSVGFSVESFLMGMLLLQMIVLSKHPLWSWLNWKSIRFMGVLSYSMYLYHAWGLAVGWKFTFLPLIGQVLVGVVATTFLAACSYYIVELPFQKLRDRWEPLIADNKPAKETTPSKPLADHISTH